jgi:hypothetical protein
MSLLLISSVLRGFTGFVNSFPTKMLTIAKEFLTNQECGNNCRSW